MSPAERLALTLRYLATGNSQVNSMNGFTFNSVTPNPIPPGLSVIQFPFGEVYCLYYFEGNV